MKLTDEQIGAELRALRPAPSMGFIAELDRRAAAGFPARQTRPITRRLSWKRLIPAAAAAALAVVVAGLALSDRGTELTSREPSQDQVQPAVGGASGGANLSAPRESVAPTTAQPLPPVPSDQLKPGQQRVQERSASLSLSTDAGNVEEVSDGVVAVTDRYHGIVASSQVNTSGGRGGASFDLRIPSQNLQAALADLSGLAHVSSRSEGSLDITAPFVTARERFDDAKATVDGLLDQLANASSASEIASIREQLRTARAELAAARAELAGLKQRADFSRLSVSVTGDGRGGSWSIGDAADDAVSVLEAIGGAALIALAVLVPLAALVALGWLGGRELQRRRREATLDG
jgi:uncharacterized protein DUF4349